VALGTILLVIAPGWAAGAIILHGIGSGLRSIMRGTVPAVLFGREGYGILMGRLSVPALPARAAVANLVLAAPRRRACAGRHPGVARRYAASLRSAGRPTGASACQGSR
jgi:hypothetical protein